MANLNIVDCLQGALGALWVSAVLSMGLWLLEEWKGRGQGAFELHLNGELGDARQKTMGKDGFRQMKRHSWNDI